MKKPQGAQIAKVFTRQLIAVCGVPPRVLMAFAELDAFHMACLAAHISRMRGSNCASDLRSDYVPIVLGYHLQREKAQPVALSSSREVLDACFMFDEKFESFPKGQPQPALSATNVSVLETSGAESFAEHVRRLCRNKPESLNRHSDYLLRQKMGFGIKHALRIVREFDDERYCSLPAFQFGQIGQRLYILVEYLQYADHRTKRRDAKVSMCLMKVEIVSDKPDRKRYIVTHCSDLNKEIIPKGSFIALANFRWWK